jgi:hypothetical protein
MAVMALVGGVYAWRTVLTRRLDDFQLPKPRALDVPLIARIALGVYVLVMALMVVRGWNRRERQAGEAVRKPWIGQFGIPALALMFLVGVGLALIAIQKRPVGHALPRDIAGPESVKAVPPSELAALGFVPDDVHLVVGIHVAEAWRTDAGRPFLDGSRPGGGDLGLDQIESLTGLKLAELDHAVVAVKLDQLLPRVFLIARTIQPFDPVEIQGDLKASKLADASGQTFYEFEMKQARSKAGLWFAEDQRTLVVVWPSTEMKEIPLKPRESLNHLPGQLRSVLEESVDPATRQAPAQVWAVGHTESWTMGATLAALVLKWPALADIRTVGAWAQLSQDAELHALCVCADGPGAEKLRAFLQPDNPGTTKGLAALLPTNSLMAADLTNTLHVTQDSNRLSLNAKVRAATIQRAMGADK